MRLITTILLFICIKANATVYYVSNLGSDANNGTSTVTAWQTIAKVNASSFSPGDQILFKCGDTWNERLNVPSSGTVGNEILFGSYSTGNKPILSGQILAGSFTNVGNIWTASTSAVARLNAVLVNGNFERKGRYPNDGQNVVSYPFNVPAGLCYGRSNTGKNKTKSNTVLPSNFVGGEIATRCNAFMWDVSTITNQLNDTLYFSPGMTYQALATDIDFVIQNHPATLDLQGEWCIDSLNNLKVYSTTSPTVYVSAIDTLFYLHQKSYVKIKGLSFTMANKTAISADTLSGVIIEDCTFSNIGKNAITLNKAINSTVLNNTISDCFNDAIFTSQYCDTILVQGNTIKKCGLFVGMGSNANDAYCGMFVASNYGVIKNNRIDSVGFNGISFFGNNVLVYRNYVTNSCLYKSDGAGIYTFPSVAQTGTIIRSNIVLNTIGYTFVPADRVAAGIYLDGGSSGITVDSNTVNNGHLTALILNHNTYVTVRANTIIDSLGTCINAPSGYSYTNINVKNNIFYQKNKLFPTVDVSYSGATVKQDSNYMLRPDLVSNQFRDGNTYNRYSLAGWISYTGFDVNSALMPSGISSTTGTLYMNTSLSDSTVVFNGRRVDAKGFNYDNQIVLKPYQSALLFPSGYIPIKVLRMTFKLIQK